MREKTLPNLFKDRLRGYNYSDMTYRALYLKYRPQTFSEVAGQEAIVKTLVNSLNSGKIAHAYLFSGPRGTGKTSMARLFAKALNCEEGLGHQCDTCDNCRMISEGSHPDVIEIDAASNNGVDQVRDLIEKIHYAPIKGRYKVYIIDEVHMMSTGAFNALLKTLEEPPSHVIFILCTTEINKVLPTIISRCQRFDFSKVPDQEMKERLLEILKKEQATYDDEAVNLLINLADGGMRDALSILDQVLSFTGNKLTTEDLLDIYGLASKVDKIKILEAVGDSDVETLLSLIENLTRKGIDLKRLITDLIELLKDLYVYQITRDVKLLKTLTLTEADELNDHLRPSQVNHMLLTLLKTLNDFKFINDSKALLEITLLGLTKKEEEIVNETPAPKVTPVVKKEEIKPVEVKKEEPKPVEIKKEPVIEAKKEEKQDLSKLSKDVPPSFLFDDAEEKKEGKKETKEEVSTLPEFSGAVLQTSGDMNELDQNTMIGIMTTASKPEREKLLNQWGTLQDYVANPEAGPFASLLRMGHPFCLCKEALILTYDLKSQANKINLKANQKYFRILLHKLLGRDVFVYALDPKSRVEMMNNYYSLAQVGGLPAKNSVKLVLPKE